MPASLLKKSLWHRCFSVNFAKFLRTPFSQNTSGRLLLSFTKINCRSYFSFYFAFFYFISVASAYNFADDNTLSGFVKTIENLISILESESKIAINWFKNNHIVGWGRGWVKMSAGMAGRCWKIEKKSTD